jgi:hypothetical protein
MGPGSLMSYPICRECGYTHPPVSDGTRCPMAKDRSPLGEEIDYTGFIASLRNILTSQIQKKNIKDTKKFLGNIIVEILKTVEEYKELQ